MFSCFKYSVVCLILFGTIVEIKCFSLDGRIRNIRSTGGAVPEKCGQGMWRCKDGECIDTQKRCDNFPDCVDESDETSCSTVTCVEGQRACQSGDCIDEIQFCDGVDHCPDGSDETGCGNETTTERSNVTTAAAVDITTEPGTTSMSNSTTPETSTAAASTTIDSTTPATPTPTIVFDNVTSDVTSDFNATTTQTLNVTSADVTTQTSTGPWLTSTPVTSSETTSSVDQTTTMTTMTDQTTTMTAMTTQFLPTTRGDDLEPLPTADLPTTTIATKTTTTESDGNYCIPMPDYGKFCKRRYRGYYRHPSNCTNFIMCEWGLLYLCRCPPLTVWDVRIENCVWTFLVPCA